MHPSKRLDGRSILITREERSNPSFEQRLLAAGAFVHGVSLTRTTSPADPGPLRRAAASLASYDWVLLTSGRAVRSLAREMREQSLDPIAMAASAAPHWGCVGPGTTSALWAEFSREPELVPSVYDAATLANEMLAHDPRPGLRVLFPAARNARPQLPALLRSAGLLVEQVVAYEIEPDPPPANELDPPHGETWDVVVFTSGLAVQILLDAVAKRRGVDGARAWLAASKTAVLGLSAAEVLRDAGIEPAVQAARPSMEDLADAILNTLGT